MQGDRKPSSRCGGEDDTADLGDAHHGAHVVLAEDPLDGDGVRLGGVQHRVDRRLDREQPLLEGLVRSGRGHGDLDEGEPTPWSTVDHAEAAPGQTGVDAEHAH